MRSMFLLPVTARPIEAHRAHRHNGRRCCMLHASRMFEFDSFEKASILRSLSSAVRTDDVDDCLVWRTMVWQLTIGCNWRQPNRKPSIGYTILYIYIYRIHIRRRKISPLSSYSSSYLFCFQNFFVSFLLCLLIRRKKEIATHLFYHILSCLAFHGTLIHRGLVRNWYHCHCSSRRLSVWLSQKISRLFACYDHIISSLIWFGLLFHFS